MHTCDLFCVCVSFLSLPAAAAKDERHNNHHLASLSLSLYIYLSLYQARHYLRSMMYDNIDAARVVGYFNGKSILITGSTGFLGKSMAFHI